VERSDAREPRTGGFFFAQNDIRTEERERHEDVENVPRQARLAIEWRCSTQAAATASQKNSGNGGLK